MCACQRLGCLDNSLVELSLGVVDLVNACAELDSLNGETLLTLPFSCSSVLLVTHLLTFVVVYTSTLDVLTFSMP